MVMATEDSLIPEKLLKCSMEHDTDPERQDGCDNCPDRDTCRRQWDNDSKEHDSYISQLRADILHLKEQGFPDIQIAIILNISIRSVQRYLNDYPG